MIDMKEAARAAMEEARDRHEAARHALRSRTIDLGGVDGHKRSRDAHREADEAGREYVAAVEAWELSGVST